MKRKNKNKLSSLELTAIITDYNAQREIVAKIYNSGGNKLGTIVAVLGLVVIAIAAIVYNVYGGQPGLYTLFFGAIGINFLYTWRKKAIVSNVDQLQNQLRKLVLPTIFKDIEDFRFSANTMGFVYKIPESIMPSYNESQWGDLIEGTFDNRRFAINEMRLTHRTTGKHSRTELMFEGVAIQIRRVNKKSPTLTVRNNRMAITKWALKTAGKGIKDAHIKVLDPELEKQYDLHCSDLDYASKVFSTEGANLFKAMVKDHSIGQFQFVASQEYIYMMIEQNHNFFELPSIDTNFDQDVDVTRLRDEVDGFVRLFRQMEELLDV